MTLFNNTLIIKKEVCPANCDLCIKACAGRDNANNLGAVIKIVKSKDNDKHGVATCYQCGESKCIESCPSEAITRNETTGIVSINTELCTCPYGMIVFNEEKQLAAKCDQCNGKPACAEACPYGVITLAKSRPIYENTGKYRDIVPKGNNLCPGCGADIALRLFLKCFSDRQDELVLQTCMGCCHLTVQAVRTATLSTLLPSVAAVMTGLSRRFQKAGTKHTLVGFIGDGTTADIGFQALSAAAERGEKYIFACYDNEGYENTGIQKSSTTPYGAWTTTTQVGKVGKGKTTPAKNVALLMAMHRIPYAATLSISHIEDFVKKVEKAKEAVKDGLVYLHIFTTCPTAFRSDQKESVKLARTAVETNYFPLWEANYGKLNLTYKTKSVLPITDFTKTQGRFKHLGASQLEIFQDMVNHNYAIIEALDKVTY
ncbi:MAG: thiamine pyrophosphate-dependent enzyme [Chloroflexi bacterium]|nr:thiamine pyrophosphate-dependent enzyme [Chloroflexota bacterium]